MQCPPCKQAAPLDLRLTEESQRLRYQVFFEEMGAGANQAGNTTHELDIDEYDSDCEHLIVRDHETLQVVGCYRIMRPEVAKRRGSFYSDSEFDLRRLHHHGAFQLLFPTARDGTLPESVQLGLLGCPAPHATVQQRHPHVA